MSTLHIVNKSPFETINLNSCLNHVKEGDSILLIEDAVLGALAQNKLADNISEKLGEISIFALLADLSARGIGRDRLISGIKTTDYAGFVELVANNERTQSWL